MMNSSIHSWSTLHALIILVTTILSLILFEIYPLIVVALFSFSLLIFLSKNEWTPHSRFGTGNFLTGIRLLLVLLIAFFHRQIPNYIIALSGFLILIGDGIDGKIARQKHESSTFGEYFDKETDALFIHMFCMLAVLKHVLGFWALLIGLLRYLFVMYLLIAGKKDRKERRSKTGRRIFVFVSCAVSIMFLPFPPISLAVAVLSIVLLLYSFGRDILWIQFAR